MSELKPGRWGCDYVEFIHGEPEDLENLPWNSRGKMSTDVLDDLHHAITQSLSKGDGPPDGSDLMLIVEHPDGTMTKLKYHLDYEMTFSLREVAP
jgi:hypothetical protein